jgi:hypothetical protein
VCEVLGTGHQSAVHPVLVAHPPRLDLLHVRVGLPLLASEIVDLDLRVSRQTIDPGPLGREPPELLGLREGRQPVPQLVDPRVQLLDVEQLEL